MKTLPCLHDSRGARSHTLFFVAVSWAVLIIKFAFAGLNSPLGVVPDMNAGDFGLAVIGVLGIWVGREYTEKNKPQQRLPPQDGPL